MRLWSLRMLYSLVSRWNRPGMNLFHPKSFKSRLGNQENSCHFLSEVLQVQHYSFYVFGKSLLSSTRKHCLEGASHFPTKRGCDCCGCFLFVCVCFVGCLLIALFAEVVLLVFVCLASLDCPVCLVFVGWLSSLLACLFVRWFAYVFIFFYVFVLLLCLCVFVCWVFVFGFWFVCLFVCLLAWLFVCLFFVCANKRRPQRRIIQSVAINQQRSSRGVRHDCGTALNEVATIMGHPL